MHHLGFRVSLGRAVHFNVWLPAWASVPQSADLKVIVVLYAFTHLRPRWTTKIACMYSIPVTLD